MAAAGALLAPPQIIGAQTPAAAVSSIAVVSSPADSVSYQAGETIQFSVQFTSTVRVAGSPVLAVDVGGTKRRALFDSVRGSEALFAYPVTGHDVDTDGVSVGADALALGTGDAITDSQGQVADLAHAAVPADAAHRVNMSVVTIEAAGTEPVPEDEPATYILRRTGSLSRALTVDLDFELDDALDDPDPDAVSGNQLYVWAWRVPRTVTFQPGQDSAQLEVPVNNDAEIEFSDGSLTMIVATDADYLVGRPAAATRILTDNNDVRVGVSSARHLGTTVEGPRSLSSSLTLQTRGPRDEPPDRFDVTVSTFGLTASNPIPEGLLTPPTRAITSSSTSCSRSSPQSGIKPSPPSTWTAKRSRHGITELSLRRNSSTTAFPSRPNSSSSLSRELRARLKRSSPRPCSRTDRP